MTHKASTRRNVRHYRIGTQVERQRRTFNRRQAEAQARVAPPRPRRVRTKQDARITRDTHNRSIGILRDLFSMKWSRP